jgi:hypothetical protein
MTQCSSCGKENSDTLNCVHCGSPLNLTQLNADEDLILVIDHPKPDFTESVNLDDTSKEISTNQSDESAKPVFQSVDTEIKSHKILYVYVVMALSFGFNLYAWFNSNIHSSTSAEIQANDIVVTGQDLKTKKEVMMSSKVDHKCESQKDCDHLNVAATCVLGVCLADGPNCLYNSDCYTDNPCVSHRCDEGTCAGALIPDRTECTSVESGVQGQCLQGVCTPTVSRGDIELVCSKEFLKDQDELGVERCPFSASECMSYNIKKNEFEPLKDGLNCESHNGALGQCSGGYCLYDEELTLNREPNCRIIRDGWGRKRKKCKKTLKYQLDDVTIKKVQAKVKKSVLTTMRYDVHIGVIKGFDGGYNLVVTNKHTQNVVRGMVDPSLVAWEVAQYTQRSNWRSGYLQVWMSPRHDGWQIPTSGSRKALRKGRAKAGWLGQLGVVDLKTYRVWLEKTFQRIEKGY